jgi:hypothetical protein
MAESRFEEHEQDLNPHRAEDERRNAESIAATLSARGARVDAGEDSEELVELLEAVERFEAAVIMLGGDRMVEDQDSATPDDPEFVLPKRRDDESVRAYIGRVERTAESLERRVGE